MFSRILLKSERIKEKQNGSYFEGHHIIPKCKGGTGTSTRPKNNSNIVFAHENYIMFANIYRTDHIFSTIYGTGERIHMDVANLYADVSEGVAVCSTRLKPSYQKISNNCIKIAMQKIPAR